MSEKNYVPPYIVSDLIIHLIAEISEQVGIVSVKNAYEAYNLLLTFNPYEIRDLLKAHEILMLDLTKESGQFRSGGVGVFAGEQLVHMAPPANMVSNLIEYWLLQIKPQIPLLLLNLCLLRFAMHCVSLFKPNKFANKEHEVLIASLCKTGYNSCTGQNLRF